MASDCDLIRFMRPLEQRGIEQQPIEHVALQLNMGNRLENAKQE
jgi:hypothetical protein